MEFIWKALREWLRGPDVEAGQTWERVEWDHNPFHEPKTFRFHILEVRGGYVRGRNPDNGAETSIPIDSLRSKYELTK